MVGSENFFFGRLALGSESWSAQVHKLLGACCQQMCIAALFQYVLIIFFLLFFSDGADFLNLTFLSSFLNFNRTFLYKLGSIHFLLLSWFFLFRWCFLLLTLQSRWTPKLSTSSAFYFEHMGSKASSFPRDWIRPELINIIRKSW
jgi:hypothetical protein